MKKSFLCTTLLALCPLLLTAQITETQPVALSAEIMPHESQQLGPLQDMGNIQPYHLSVRYDSAGLDSFINWAMGFYHIPGVATWTSKNGQVIWQQCYGWANIEDSIPVADTTLFMLASISKTFTATAVMQLWERGVFELDNDINDYLPFDVRNPNYHDSIITVRMLMTHTSSIRDNWPVIDSLYEWGGDSPIPLGSFLEDYLVPGGVYYDSTANFRTWPPGHAWDYCNVAVALFGYLVEELADSFPLYCQDSIFNPLSMDETSWFLAGLDTNNIAVPYHWAGSYYQPYQHYGNPYYPCDLLRTSTLQLARHLVAFMQYGMIDSVRILDSTTVELMMTIQYEITPSWKMGLIWWYYYFGGRWLWCHNGADYGVSTIAAFCPAEGSAVIVLTNGESEAGKFAIMNALFDYAEQYGIEEQQVTKPIESHKNLSTTIFSGPLHLPEGKKCRVFDITGRVVKPDQMKPGVYFIKVGDQIVQKVIKVR